MAAETGDNERIVDLDAAGESLPDLIEDAARRGERLVVERGGVRLGFLEPNPKLQEPFGRITRGEAFALLDRMRETFADQSPEDIERETAKALAEARADIRAEAEARARAS